MSYGGFVSIAFQWHGTLSDLAPLDRALAAAGLVAVDIGETAENQRISGWNMAIDGSSHEITCRCYDAGAHVATTLDIEEERFDELAVQIGRRRLIEVFVGLAAELVRSLDLQYAFFEEEAEADLAPDRFDGSRLFGITIVPENARWLDRALARDDIQRVDRLPGVVVIYRRLDPVPHLG